MIKITICDEKGKVSYKADKASELLNDFTVTKEGEKYVSTLKKSYNGVYGFGEKFDRVNQKGYKVLSSCIEKCFDQGEFTYCPMPFFMTTDGYGFYVDTLLSVEFDFTGDIKISFTKDTKGNIANIYVLQGTPAQILNEYKTFTGGTKLFPKWSFGVWMSSNRWHNDEEVYEQLEELKKSKLPMNAMVLECWSDMTTYYIWNGAKYKKRKGNDGYKYEDFDFSESVWKNPKKLIKDTHDANVKVLLWELPVYADGRYLNGYESEQRQTDNKWAIENKECVMNDDGTPYRIPKGNWYDGSTIVDFTNPKAVKNWFSKKQYLLDIGIDGFKTDGGEFIYSDKTVFHDGTTGLEMKNGYCQSYIEAYDKFIGDERINYSRAGYTKQPSISTHWAGDQQSTWSEFRGIMKAGITASMSGIAVWGFDLAGFAGWMPSKDLYKRATQAAVFSPIMQWHSEPVCNGPCDPNGEYKTNDRSPWNMAKYLKDDNLIEELRFHYNLRSNLIPYLYNLMVNAKNTGVPIMKHPLIDYPQDVNFVNTDDQFMLGDIMVAPVLNGYIYERNVYLPKGKWYDLYTQKPVEGGKTIKVKLDAERIPAYLRDNGCIVLNTDSTGKLGTFVGNDVKSYNTLTFMICGSGKYNFVDDLGNEIDIVWNDKTVETVKNKTGIKFNIVRIK